jgi:hypothetical protein
MADKISGTEAAETCEPAALLAQSGGFVTSGSGMPAGETGVINLFLGLFLGAFCGMMGGFIVAHLSRYLSFLTGRQLWGGRWVIIGAAAGALLIGLKACLENRD